MHAAGLILNTSVASGKELKLWHHVKRCYAQNTTNNRPQKGSFKWQPVADCCHDKSARANEPVAAAQS